MTKKKDVSCTLFIYQLKVHFLKREREWKLVLTCSYVKSDELIS